MRKGQYRSHCYQGHPMSGENVYRDRKGRRYCRTCIRKRSKALPKMARGGPACIKCGASEWQRRGSQRWCVPCKRADNKRYGKATKETVIAGYGGRCSCCGETELAFLSIDHINGRGEDERAVWGKRLYARLIQKGFPAGYRVLCHNCNLGRSVNGGICPHDSRHHQIGPVLEQR